MARKVRAERAANVRDFLLPFRDFRPVLSGFRSRQSRPTEIPKPRYLKGLRLKVKIRANRYPILKTRMHQRLAREQQHDHCDERQRSKGDGAAIDDHSDQHTAVIKRPLRCNLRTGQQQVKAAATSAAAPPTIS